MKNASPIFHVSSNEDIDQAQARGAYQVPSLVTEGFIHCCNADQLAGVVSRYYAQIDHLKLLVIDPALLNVELVRENTVGGCERFPHIYGPINLDAIVEVRDFSLNSAERMALQEHE